LTVNYLGGPEKTDNDSDLRHTVDLIGRVALSPKVALGVELLGASEEGSAADGGSATWTGAAVYLRTDPTPRFALTLRAEMLDDQDGNRTGTTQRLWEATLAAQLKVADGCSSAARSASTIRTPRCSPARTASGARSRPSRSTSCGPIPTSSTPDVFLTQRACGLMRP